MGGPGDFDFDVAPWTMRACLWVVVSARTRGQREGRVAGRRGGGAGRGAFDFEFALCPRSAGLWVVVSARRRGRGEGRVGGGGGWGGGRGVGSLACSSLF